MLAQRSKLSNFDQRYTDTKIPGYVPGIFFMRGNLGAKKPGGSLPVFFKSKKLFMHVSQERLLQYLQDACLLLLQP